jgi:predicted ATPase/DNA-binding SARP family transcriptional activator
MAGVRRISVARPAAAVENVPVMATPLRVDVLGALRVRDAEGRDLTPTGILQRRLLALLVLRRGRVVSTDAAIAALWPDELPHDPAAALQNHVARLRRHLPGDLVEFLGTGYLLDANCVEVDADRLLELIGEVPERVSVELREILARWHGPAYPDLEDVDDALAEAARLDEVRHRALEVVAEARLAAGDLDGLVTDLVVLVGSDPLRERPRSLLMTALASTGRTVEALRVFDEFRRLLGDELGIEPSPELIAQHAALLAGTAGRTRPARSRLPAPSTPLIGRDALVAQLVEHVGAQRLVTMVGPGGVGKTRLLIELGQRVCEQHAELSVVWCELGQADAASAPDVVAAALGIDGRPGIPTVDRIVDVVGDDEMVLLLDNCEHVLDAAAAVVDGLLVGCPHLRVVATSRERLRLPGEQLCPVPPLVVADERSPAVELFVARARSVVPDFDPDGTARGRIVEIVDRLDGLPLAIELAAARLHSLELGELAVGLDRRFELLSSGYRTTTRHASLAAAVSWSFDSLAPPLQRCFSALSVFSRSFAVDDVMAVCGLAEAAAVDLLSELVERSLVQRTSGGRYALLETLRAYGAEQLVASEQADDVAERHARWMVEWIEAADRALATPGRPVLTEIDDAVPELRVALSWLIDHRLLDHAGRLALALVDYGFLRVRPDVLQWAELVLTACPDEGAEFVPELLSATAYMAWMRGDLESSSRLIHRALATEEAMGTGRRAPRLRIVRGNIDLFSGRLAEAAEWYEAAIAAAHDDAVERFFARSTQLLALGYAHDERAAVLADELLRDMGAPETPFAAYSWYCAGEADLSFDVERARTRLATAIELAEVTNASFVRGIAGASKASIEARLGDPAVAMADYRWLIEHWRRAGMWSTQWTMLRSVAALLERVGRYEDAAVLEGAVRSTQAGHRIFGADAIALDELGTRLAAALGDDAYAAAIARGARLDGTAAVEHALRVL